MISFSIPTLGGQSLSSNAGGAKRHPFAISAAKNALGEAAYFSALAACGPVIRTIEGRVDIALTFYICHGKKPGDGLYRFTDPSNGGGDVAKPILDYGLVKTGLIEDDDYKHVRYFITSVEHVETLAEERIEVQVNEVIDA